MTWQSGGWQSTGVGLTAANSWTALQTFAAGALLGSDDTLAWGDAVGGGTADTILQRTSANILALRNGATAQELQVYNTWTNASNYEAGILQWTSNIFVIGNVKAGSGTQRTTYFKGSEFKFETSAVRWVIEAGGNLIPGAIGNLYDVGSSSVPTKTVYAGTSVVVQVPTTLSAMSLKHLTELTTIAAAATTDTTIQIPANSLVLGVTVRVTTIIPTAATFDVGVAGATTRYGTGILVAANTTNASPGTTNPTIYSAAASIRITPDLTPGDTTGRVRVTIHYLDLTAPTS